MRFLESLVSSASTTEYMLDAIHRIYANDHFFTYDSILKTCDVVENMMRELHLEEVKTLHFPAKGTNDHGGWLMPLGWLVTSARLERILADGSREKICSYDDTPCSLMLYSQRCDVTAEMVTASSGEEMNGKFVLVTDHFFNYQESMEYFRKGAVGVLGGWLPSDYQGKPGYEYLDDVCQWHNYSIPFWTTEPKRSGFSLTPHQSKHLQALLAKEGKVMLHALVDASLSEGTVPIVTGLLPGETDEEIVLTGHLFEQGADDNASGCAMSLGIVKEIIDSGVKPKRGIRLMFTHEIKSLQAYLNSNPVLPNLVAGLNLDMVGVSDDLQVNIGDSYPVFMAYAPCLLKALLEENGMQVRITTYPGMDDHFATPEYRVPMSFIDMYGTSDYHKSSDTPERISRPVLEKMFRVAGTYVKFLMNAGYDQAVQLAEIVVEYVEHHVQTYLMCQPGSDRQPTCPIFAAWAEKQRLDSIVPLVEASRRDQFRRYLLPFYARVDEICERMENVKPHIEREESLDELSKIVFTKNYRGFFSFEKWVVNPGEYPEIASLLQGWSAPGWIQNMLMWADGKRSALDILWMLANSGNTAEARLMLAMIRYLAKEKYISIKNS